ncbi:MAG: type II secretion system protein [Deltaproteobacteria bacterium]|nr:type II secretion system protein [Deltaproteobacteria bacterium]
MKNRKKNNPTHRTRTAERGFTLLEVLVAIMILALSVTAILQQFSVALRSGSKAGSATEAVMHAREKIEELKIAKELTEETESGAFDDGCEWETQITAYVHGADADEAEEVYEGLRFETFELRAVVRWREGERERELELKTLKSIRKKKWK